MPGVRARAAIAPILLGASLLLAQAAAPAFAQPRPAKAPPAQADPAAEARARFNEGVAFAKKQQWQKAYAAFAEAWKLKTHPQIALNLGRAEMEVGKNRDAVAHLQLVVDHAEAADADRRLAREWLAELDGKVGRLAITVDVAGAEVLVNGVPQGKSPLPSAVIVDPGKQEIEIRRGSGPETRIVEVTAGATVELKFEAAKKEPDAPPLPPARTIVVMESPRPWRTPLLVTGGSLSVAGLVLGGVFLGLSLDKASAKQQVAQDPYGFAAMADAAESEALFKNGMLWSFVGAGVAIAGTTALFFTTRPSAGPRVQGGFRFGGHGASALIQGEF